MSNSSLDLKIVIVEDDFALLRSLSILLSEKGYDVIGFSDPAKADLYLSNHDEIDILLLDFMMCGMNGDELLYRIASSGNRPGKTIVMTGHREEIVHNPIFEVMEVRDIIGKPLDLEKLCKLIAA